MDARVIAALIVGVAVGAVGIMILACLFIDSIADEREELYNEIYDSGRAERETTSEIQREDGDDIHAE